MNAIMGLAGLALKTDLDARQKDYLTKIEKSSRSLLGIINEILDYSKIEAGRLELESIGFDLVEVMENVADMFVGAASDKQLDIVVTGSHYVPVHLIGDPLRLGQVLINLTNNAIKFTQKGHIIVRVSFLRAENGSAELLFSVQDTGIGIAQEHLPKLFQSFSQADSSMTRKYGGTGLGLSISRHLVEMMGGKIWAESEEGKGSTFNFTVRFKVQQQHTEPQWTLPEHLAGSEICVIDDCPAVGFFFQEVLIAAGLRVHYFACADDFWKQFDPVSKPEIQKVIVVDAIMPDIQGIDLIERIRKDPGYQGIPVVLMTSYQDESAASLLEQQKIQGIMVKPLKQNVLLESICGFLDGTEAQKTVPGAADEALHAHYLRQLSGSHWLLAEDNEINQQVAVALLQEVGADVTIADNGVEAIRCLKTGQFTGILTDIQMPEMDGYELTRFVRSREDYADLPVIAMTAHAMSGYREKCLAAGMNDYISKPIDQKDLYETLLRQVGRGGKATGAGAGAGAGAGTGAVTEDKIHARVHLVIKNKAAPQGPFVLPISLPGVEIQRALARLGGNERIMRDMLLAFRKKYTTAQEDLQQLLEKGEVSDAVRMVHTIKGLAGSIGAESLQTACRTLESALKSDTPDMGLDRENLPWQDFIHSLHQVIESTQSIEQIQDAAASEPPHLGLDPERLRHRLTVLDQMLQENNFEAADTIKQIQQETGKSQAHWLTWLAEVSENIDEFEFERAREILADGLHRLDHEYDLDKGKS
jgi:CheY-like chemotaxis protein